MTSGTYSTIVSSAEDSNIELVKQNFNAMLSTLQELQPGAVALSFTWVDYSVINQVTYVMEYEYNGN